jgi:hypothetical protein
MQLAPSIALSRSWLAFVAATLTLVVSCGGEHRPAGNGDTPDETPPATAALPTATAVADSPDTGDMGPFVLAKINANPNIAGKATLVEFRQKSVSTQPLGDRMKSAVVEFEGVVTFSGDVSWSWQGPTKAGAPQKFEARAEYVDQGQGWQLVEPIGIYPL